jgi:hypothetical protein
MIGVAPEVVKQFGEPALLKLLGHRSTAAGVYQRENADKTAPLPLAKHLYWADRGLTLVKVTDLGGMQLPAPPAEPVGAAKR